MSLLSGKALANEYGVIGIYTTVFLSAYKDLWSGGSNDPLVEAEIDARERLAVDGLSGGLYPYDITVSVYGLGGIDRDKEFLEDVGGIMAEQKMAVHVVVFKDLESKERVIREGKTIIGRI